MTELFVPYEIALELKNKNFNEACFGHYNVDEDYADLGELIGPRIDDSEYIWPKGFNFVVHYNKNNNGISAPLYQQVVDWFREKGVKIVENPQNGWEIWLQASERFCKEGEFSSIDETIKHALKLI